MTAVSRHLEDARLPSIVAGTAIAAPTTDGAAVRERARRLDEWEAALAERERELAAQRASLVQVVSHEFRTPLTVIRGSLETLRRPDAAADTCVVELLEATARAVNRLENMAEVILAAADDQGFGDTVESLVELAEVVDNVARSIGPDVRRRLALDLHDARLVTVEPYLWLALRCLLDNAVKFSPPDEPIEVAFRADGGRAVITLRDHGPGLPDGFEGLAFEPFTQADTSLRRSHAGLGMGLYTARCLARRLGGDVELRTLGRGGAAADLVLPYVHVRGARVPAVVAGDVGGDGSRALR